MNKTENINSRRWIILVVVLLIIFMATLDGSIVNVALPVMSQSLNVSTSSIQLVVTSYLITVSALILIFGRLGDLLGKSRVFKFGIVIFTFGSLLCGLSHSFMMLVISRIIQAIGSAATMANSQGIITHVFPAHERGRALGMTGTFVALGALTGPALGGLIVGALSWEYIFLINIPIGIIGFLMAMKILPHNKIDMQEKLDLKGSLLFMLTIIPMFAAIEAGGQLGYQSPPVLLGLGIAALSFISFLFTEKRQAEPLLDLSIFKNSLFSLSLFCGFLSFIALFASNIIQPFYLQNAMGFSPSFAGMLLMIYPAILAVVAPVSGYMSDKIGSEFLTFIGLLITSLGLFLMSTLTVSSTLLVIVTYTALLGIGNGLFQSPNNSLIMSTVPKHKLGIAGSVNALIRNMGMVFGIALSTTILYSRMSSMVGYVVTDYIEGQSDIFIYGMHGVYLVAGTICLVGALLTAFRLIRQRQASKSSETIRED
ncbi:MFS transporter [Eubacteriaceae bacterium ES3]|nr:MFS transporter [Eubacteriaceae bacterium ES3]